jgi:benzoyl-CoA reductase subunit BamC
MKTKKKIIRTVEINADRCTGCRLCESVCSSSHADPEYGVFNPEKSRIRVFRDERNDLFIPIMAGPHTDVECKGKNMIVIGGKEYNRCSFCRASCPSRDLFKDPDTGLPLRCDLCGDSMPEGGPRCVKWCFARALTYREVEEAGYSYYIDPEKCTACMACAKKCPSQAIAGGKDLIHVIDQDKCTKCGTCFDTCRPRFGAVTRIFDEPVPAPIPEEARGIVRKATKTNA